MELQITQNKITKTDSLYFRKKIVLLNFTATLLVVLLHALPNERFGLNIDNSSLIIYSTRAICQIGVPMFFFISAVLFYITCNNFQEIIAKILRRFKSLVIPYFIWNAIFVTIYLIITNIPSVNNHMNMGKAICSIKDIIVGIVDSRFTPLWFIKILIFYTISAPIIYLVLQKKVIFLLSFVLSIAYSLTLKNDIYDSYFLWLPIYLSGAYFGYYKINLENRRLFRYIFVILTLCVIILSLYDFSHIMYFRFLMPIAIWVGCDWFLQEYIRNGFVVKSWMNCTFFLYCTHYFVLNIIEKIAVINFQPSNAVIILTLIISFSITVVFLLKIALKIKDYPIYKVLTGGR